MVSFLDAGSCAWVLHGRKEPDYSYHKNIEISMASVSIRSRCEMLTIAIATAVKTIKGSQTR